MRIPSPGIGLGYLMPSCWALVIVGLYCTELKFSVSLSY
jgi:hypothetical protein